MSIFAVEILREPVPSRPIESNLQTIMTEISPPRPIIEYTAPRRPLNAPMASPQRSGCRGRCPARALIISRFALLLVALSAFVLAILASIPTAPFPERLWWKIVSLFFTCITGLYYLYTTRNDPTIRDARWN